MHFELSVVTCTKLKDSKDRPIPTVVAKPLSEQHKEQIKATARSDEDELLLYMHENPGKSLRDIAVGLRWKLGPSGKPYQSKVQRVLKGLAKQPGKFTELERGQWKLTGKGKAEAKRIKKEETDE